jgi:hypothetical protein
MNKMKRESVLTIWRDFLRYLVASLVRPLNILRVVVQMLLGLVPVNGGALHIFDGQRAIRQVRCVVRTVLLRIGAEQGPASSPWCDLGRIVVSTVTSEKRHDLSFGEEEEGS